MSAFRGMNLRFPITLEDENETIIGVSNVTSIEVKLYPEKKPEDWLQFAWPTKEGFLPVAKASDDSAFIINVDAADTVNAPLGQIVVQATFHFTDSNYGNGYRVITQKGRIFTMYDAR